MIVNTPYGAGGPRVDGYEIRTAAAAHGHARASPPCRALAAAVQGIEAARGDGIGVRSLQDCTPRLRKARS